MCEPRGEPTQSGEPFGPLGRMSERPNFGQVLERDEGADDLAVGFHEGRLRQTHLKRCPVGSVGGALVALTSPEGVPYIIPGTAQTRVAASVIAQHYT